MHDVTVEDHKALAASVECTFAENKTAATRRFSKIAPIDRIIPLAPPVDLYPQALCPLPGGFAWSEAALIFRCSRRGNLATQPRNNCHIDPSAPFLSPRFSAAPLAALHQPPSYNFEVLAARNGCSMGRQESAMRLPAIPLTLVHLDPECRP
jgi:hypothetical protein